MFPPDLRVSLVAHCVPRACDRQEMLIRLDWKGFEAALIDWSSAGGVMVGMPALRMGDGDPPQYL